MAGGMCIRVDIKQDIWVLFPFFSSLRWNGGGVVEVEHGQVEWIEIFTKRCVVSLVLK